MSRRTKMTRPSMAALASAALLAGPVAAACSPGPTYEDWAATDGASGRINLDEVQKAFKDSEGTSDFEKRVNEIYEGDGIVLIRAQQDGETLTLEGWEDLDGSKAIEDASDDILFSIVRDHDRQHELRGHGSNGYYRSGFGGGDFLFTYMMISALSPRGYYYSTPVNRYGTMQNNRTNYRSSAGYRSQVSKNTSYFSKQKSFQGSKYTNATKSTARNSYLNSQKTSGSFKSSGTGVRSSWGSNSRTSASRSSGGFRGGGGGARIVGFVRPSLR
ncbi:MAG: hypothetical protein CL694_04200 [Chloroflexi bacterium]|nr:hypothetical protein [Chloroflexota bacterium]MDP6422862.1 hypothetical protein [SAR202 cluster bacterium]MDP6665440.1 hypothetical protein [SAR202 cluster bacterium]